MRAQRRPEAVARTFLQTLGSALGCVTSRRLEASVHPYSTVGYPIAVFRDPVPLRSPSGGPSGLLLDVAHGFEVVEVGHSRLHQQWRVATRMYEYSLLDHNHEELLAYHWQPGPDFDGPDHPHLHISAALDARVDAVTHREIGLDKLYIATGRVSVAACVRMLITEFGIAPLRHDWQETLDRIEAALQDDSSR